MSLEVSNFLLSFTRMIQVNHTSKKDSRHSRGRTVPRTKPTQPAGILPDIITGNEEDLGEYRNCVGCGFIYNLADFEIRDSCNFCSRPLTMKSRKENRRRKEEGEDEEGLVKAEILRDRLYQYDQASIAAVRPGVVEDIDVAWSKCFYENRYVA